MHNVQFSTFKFFLDCCFRLVLIFGGNQTVFTAIIVKDVHMTCYLVTDNKMAASTSRME